MRIRYGFKKKAECAMKKRYLPEMEKRYFDSKYGYLDLSALGIHSVKLFADLTLTNDG
jgi:hypothetical protein